MRNTTTEELCKRRLSRGLAWARHTVDREIRRDGSVLITENFLNAAGELHRTNGPAIVQRAIDSDFPWESENYYRNGLFHRDGGPAEIVRKKGKVTKQVYFRLGVRHREDGPAQVEKTPDGRTRIAYYFKGHWVKNGPKKPSKAAIARALSKPPVDIAP